MGTVNIQVTHKGYNLSGYLISYERVNELCSGVGTLSITVDQTVPRTFNPGDTLSLSEDGNTVGTYFIKQIHINPEKGYTIEAQDASMWMEAYFLFKTYKSKGLTTKYWIGFILAKAKITYNFTTSEPGYALSPTSELGMESAYDAVLRLCQQSGWYFYFDGNNVCQIGTLNSGWSNPDISIITANGNVIDEYADDVDDQLRNRVVVYGGNGINVELSTKTIWDRDAKDKRTVVFSNGYINSYSTANMLGSKILNTYSRTVGQKIYTVVGHVDTSVGKTARCKTNVFRGVGRITRLSSRTNEKDGFVTQIDLDKRCPRLIGYWRTDPGEYVYVGTANNGVYRKSLDGSTWSSYNTGLTSLAIRDMKIKNGLLACTASGNKVFMRDVSESAWTNITPLGFTTSGLVDKSTNKFTTAGVTIDEATGTITAGFNEPSDVATSGRAWVMKYFPDTTYSFTPVVVSGVTNITILDTDYDGTATILTARMLASGGSDMWNYWLQFGQGLYSDRNPNLYSLSWNTTQETEVVALGTTNGPETITSLSSVIGSSSTIGEIFYGNMVIMIHQTYIRFKYNILDSGESVTILSFLDTLATDNMVRGTTFDGDTLHLIQDNVHYTFVISTQTFTTVKSDIITWDTSGSYSGAGVTLKGTKFFTSRVWYNRLVLYWYDVLTETEGSTQQSFSFNGGVSYSTNNAYWRFFPGPLPSTSNTVVCAVLSTFSDGVSDFSVLSTRFQYITYNIDTNTVSKGYTDLYTWNTPSTNRWALWPSVQNAITSDGDPTNPILYRCELIAEDTNGVPNDEYYPKLAIVEMPSAEIVRELSRGPLTPTSDWYEDGNWARTWHSSVWLTIGGQTVAGRGASFYTSRSNTVADTTTWVKDWLIDLRTGVKWDTTSFINLASTYTLGKNIDERDDSVHVRDSTYRWFAYNYKTGEKQHDYSVPYSVAGFRLYTGFVYLFAGSETATSARAVLSVDGFAPPTPGSGYSLVALSDGLPTITASGDTFGIIGTFETNPSGYMFIENSQSSPSLFFGGTVLSSGLVSSGELQKSDTNLVDSLRNITIVNNTYIPDVRSAPYLELEGPGTFDSYIFAPYSGGLYYKSVSGPSGVWSNLEVFSGKIHRLEVGNLDPYVFVSISGAPSVFWQLDPYETTFINYSTGLPSSNITVIRLDDRI